MPKDEPVKGGEYNFWELTVKSDGCRFVGGCRGSSQRVAMFTPSHSMDA